ncbi:MAG: 2-oxoacid:acceptor oxidoreductase family protein [Opitutales bacterium]
MVQQNESKKAGSGRGIEQGGPIGTCNPREHGYVPDRLFEIRFESIGGLGAHAAGQILATGAVLGLGLNGAHFSSYGSEKKGSVVRSFVRVGPSEMPVRTSAPVETPDAIVVFHEALLKSPVTFAGLKADGTILYTAPPGQPVPPAIAGLPATVHVARVDALQIAGDEHSRPNAVLLGALCALLPFLETKVVLDYLGKAFDKKHPAAVQSNERAFQRGAAELELVSIDGDTGKNIPSTRFEPLWGYETAPIGGVLPRPGNSAWNDLSTARMGWIPVFDEDRCIHCGLCDLVCPDYCFVWKADRDTGVPTETRLMGIDYRYCKGCMRCIESCPTGALTREIEKSGMADKLRVPLFPEIIA